jgi:hypothetical protein
MSEPEIARRCLACGASIRTHAFFCPQCGAELGQTDFSQTLPSVPVAHVKNNPSGKTEGEADRDIGRDTLVEFAPTPQSASASKPPATAKPATPPRVAVGGKLQRAATRARGVEGDMKQRARKVREISGVVLDEAGDDPSLRFVLVAAVLFGLFLVIVLLNKFIN